MKIGLIYYNFGAVGLAAFLDYARATGFTHVELAARDLPGATDSAEAAREQGAAVARQLASRGLRLSALGAGNDFLVRDPAEVDRQVGRMRRVLALAEAAGAGVIRAEGGRPKESVPREAWVETMVASIRRVLPDVEARGIPLAVDNHGLITNDAGLQLELFMEVGSPLVGANLDTMNYRWAGHDLTAVNRFYRLIAPHTLHTHFKDGRGSRGSYQGLALGDGELDLDAAVDALRAAGYAGVWCVEYEGDGDPKAGYRQGYTWLKRRIAART